MDLRSLLLVWLLAAPVAVAAPCPTHATWPTTEWPRNPVDPAAKAVQLQALEDYAFTLTGVDSARQGLRTDALLIIKSGAIVYERYARGYDETKRHLSWSVAKSFTSTLTGVAVQQGALSLDDSICTHLAGYSGDACKITVRNSITFTTALLWQEEYEDQAYQVSSVIAMLFGVGHRDQLGHILRHRLVGEPGEVWSYSTGDAELAAVVAKRALQQKTRDANPFWSLFFDRIGLSGVVLEEDVKGTPLGGSMVYATPRDYARFAYFSMNDGCWDNQRILPEGWMQAATTVSDGFRLYAPAGEKTPAGYSWWLNRPVPERGLEKPWKDAPDDTFAALGHWGQKVIIIPSEKVIVVRTGDDRNASVSTNQLIKLSLEVTR